MESFKRGDRVTLKAPLGPLKTDDVGLIVEVYADDENLFDVEGSKDMELDMNRGLFDYGVAFPMLRAWKSPESMAWIPEDLDLSQFHAGDVIPVAHDELVFVDSELREES